MDSRVLCQLCTALCVLLAVQQQLVLGCLQLAGQDVLFPATAPTATVSDGFSRRELTITPNLVFSCSGTVDKWHAYFDGSARSCFVEFRVWRPQDSPGCPTGSYELVGRNTFQDVTIVTNLYGQFVPPSDEVTSVEPGYVAGVYVDCGNRAQRLSVQTNAHGNGLTTFVDATRPAELRSLTELSTCARGVSQESIVPLLTANVTQAITTTMMLTTAPTDAVSTPTTSLATETAPVTTAEDMPMTTLDQTTLSPSTTNSPTLQTTDNAGGIDSHLNQSTSVPPASGEGVSLTTLVVAVVTTVVTCAVCVGGAVVLYRCVWRRARKKKRAEQLAARNTEALHNPSYEMERYRSETLSDKELDGVYDLAAEPYEEPIKTLTRSQTGQMYSQPSGKMRGRPLPPAKDDYYEVPNKQVFSLSQENVYSCIPESTNSTLTADRELPQAVASEYLTPRNMQEDRGNLECGVQDKLTGEVSIYEPLPV